ncbi:MAG TPA: YkvA family protein [Chloroflexia bacterium]|nr:YkvA family protein [Chloroflexia bacterium]
MSTRTTPPAGRSTIQSMMDNGQLTWRLLQDDRVSTLLKVAIPLVVALYFVMPFDVIPDFIPVLGQLDDIGVILLGMTLFINLAPRDVVNEHRLALGLDAMPGKPPVAGKPGTGTKVIDGTYRSDDRA